MFSEINVKIVFVLYFAKNYTPVNIKNFRVAILVKKCENMEYFAFRIQQ